MPHKSKEQIASESLKKAQQLKQAAPFVIEVDDDPHYVRLTLSDGYGYEHKLRVLADDITREKADPAKYGGGYGYRPWGPPD